MTITESASQAFDLPLGADTADEWQDIDSQFRPYRIVQGPDRHITDNSLVVTTTAVQWGDGTIEDGTNDECPKIWIDQSDLNSDQARELAAVLLESATLIDGWAQR